MNRIPSLLSKTKLMRGYRCMKAIYLTTHQPKLEAPITPELQALFDQGNQVGEKARTFFPGGVLIDNVPWDFTGALAKTRSLIAAGTPLIYEAAFEYMGCYARADIIRYSPESGRWQIFEVKSSTKVKPEQIDDVGLQAWIMAKSGLPIESIHIMHLNNACRYPDLSNLFITQDVTETVRNNYLTIKPKVKEIFDTIRQPTIPNTDIGPHCQAPTECGFMAHCWGEKKLPTPNVFNLPGIRDRQWELYNDNIIALDDERLSDLTELQQRMIDTYKSKQRFIDKEAIKKEIESLKLEAERASRVGDYAKVAEIQYGKLREKEEDLKKLELEMQNHQNELIKEEVTAENISEVIAKWTGIPVTKLLQSEREKLLNLETELHQRVVGQEEAISAVADAIRRNRAGLNDEKKPIGSFLFLGTTGVGKTELAKALAEFLFDDENNMTRIDMSEYQERHSVSRLVGAPPGYVGYDEGGQLTEAVRRRPYSVVLLDEIEKAHPDVFNTLLQVLDDGRLTDNKGRVVNFKNSIIIMTSNLGSHLIQENFENITDDNVKEVVEKTKDEVFTLLKQTLRPEFLNRIDEIVLFQPLTKKEIGKIVHLQLRAFNKMLEKRGIFMTATEDAIDYLTKKGYDPSFGARPLKRVLQQEVLNRLSKEILAGKINDGDRITLDYFEESGLVFRPVEK